MDDADDQPSREHAFEQRPPVPKKLAKPFMPPGLSNDGEPLGPPRTYFDVILDLNDPPAEAVLEEFKDG